MNSLSTADDRFKWGVMILLALIIKLIMIRYGLPFQTHVDEMTILKDPFKLLIGYSQGDFSNSTNIYNWLITGWFALIYLGGLVSGHWFGLAEFKTFLISDSYEVLFAGRFLSLILSTIAIWILLRLVSQITKQNALWWAFALMIVFNPIDLNSTNWVKFDAPAFLMYAIILYLAHQYFVEGKEKARNWLYFVMILGLGVRIEIISYLAGFTFCDVFFFRKGKGEKIGAAIKPLVKPVSIGIGIYLILTLLPITVLYNFLFQQNSVSELVTSPTFEQAILSKIAWNDGLMESIKNSSYYLYSFLALLGPVIFLVVCIEVKNRRSWFLYMPLLIMIFFLLVFPSKGTHYLLNISLISIYLFMLFVKDLPSKAWQYSLTVASLIWILSFSFIQLFLIETTGDIRVPARAYLLNHTLPDDHIYFEGIFSQIQDKPDRYKLKAEAARATGSTGLSNDFFAQHLTDDSTRFMHQVFYYDDFAGSKYQGIFINKYDFNSMLKDSPKYFVYVGQYYGQLEFDQTAHFKYYFDFYEQIKSHYSMEKVFDYPSLDPRLKFATSYYFRPVIIYRLRKQNLN